MPSSGTASLNLADVPSSWQNLPCWRVLDTSFGDGLEFFKTWNVWSADAQRPQILHYVALGHTLATPADLTTRFANEPALLPMAHELAAQWFGLLPGFHRFLLAQGRVILTLCLGETVQLLRQQQFHADAVVVCAGPNACLRQRGEPWTNWTLKALVRCCRRGTTLRFKNIAASDTEDLRIQLQQLGLNCSNGTYDPTWTLKNSRHSMPLVGLPIERCVVIGAGLAGASVAAALARRGWQVQVLDRAAQPSMGASGLPVGLLVPHVSSDDCNLSKLSRAGVRLMLQTARQHLKEGVHWAPSGVLERQINDTPQLPAQWTDSGKEWSKAAQPDDPLVGRLGKGLWHPTGAWIKPSQWVRAALDQPGVTFQGDAEVCALKRRSGVWHVLDSSGAMLGVAERVVVANACGAQDIIRWLEMHQPDLRDQLYHLPTTYSMRGLLSWAMHTRSVPSNLAFPHFPVNGSGSLISQIPMANGVGWFMGSSYQPGNQSERSDQDNHSLNYEHLCQLLPELANQLQPAFADQTLQSWKGTRCVTSDRMPLVGALDGGDDPSLWICAGMGSRGLCFAVLCAELLVARMGAEPLPVEISLAKSLDARRA